MLFPVLVLLRNQNKRETNTIVTNIVITCVDFNARPSLRPVISLNSRALIINFSVFGNENHKKHHNEKDKKYCNYGPDPIDHMMNTNCDNQWEDMVHHVPNILISYAICSYIYNK